jgi:hypothetical protein
MFLKRYRPWIYNTSIVVLLVLVCAQYPCIAVQAHAEDSSPEESQRFSRNPGDGSVTGDDRVLAGSNSNHGGEMMVNTSINSTTLNGRKIRDGDGQAGDRVRPYHQSSVWDSAFSRDNGCCVSPGLADVSFIDRTVSFCWISALDGECCTLSKGTLDVQSPGEDVVSAGSELSGEDDEQGKPEVQQITQKVLEVLPEAEKVNFALAKDGAKVLASNQGAKRVGALLDDDSDTFMRNDCKDNKWVVLELSQVAKVSSLEIGQHELYSSRVKTFSVYGMQSHPRTLAMESSNSVDSNGWYFMGKYEASKSKGVQKFVIEHPRWARYLLIRFLTHYGTESVCAINEVSVYGTSAAEELEAQLAEDELVFDSLEKVEKQGKSQTVDPVPDEAPTVGTGEVQGNNLSTGGEDFVKSDRDSEEVSNMTDDMVGSDKFRRNESQNHIWRTANVSVMMANEFGNAADHHSRNMSLMMCPDVRMWNSSSLHGTSNLSSSSASVTSELDNMPVPKPKQGGSVYEILVSELRATKAQQKMTSKSLENIHKNLDIVAEEIASLRVASGVDDHTMMQNQLSAVEEKLEKISRMATSQSKAAISLLAAIMGSMMLQLDIFQSHKSVLVFLAKSLVTLNVIAGSALILKGISIPM